MCYYLWIDRKIGWIVFKNDYKQQWTQDGILIINLNVLMIHSIILIRFNTSGHSEGKIKNPGNSIK